MNDISPLADNPYRVAPTIWIGFAVYAGYLAIFYTTWAVNQVDYTTIGTTVESAKLHYALPTLFGCAFLVVAVSVLGWWRPVLFECTRSGPRWAWAGPVTMLLLAVASYFTLRPDRASAALVMWSVLGGIGVGVGEELITRGTMIVALRSRFTEGKVWLIGTLAFSALHFPNMFFGLPPAAMFGQLVLTFVMGTLLYATRRLSGTLLLPIFLHGLWDSGIFLPRATGADAFLPAYFVYLAAIACAIPVIRRSWHARLGAA